MGQERKVDSYVDSEGTKTSYVGAAKTKGEVESEIAAAKYNPVLRSKEKTAAEVQAMGGLGAVAAAAAAAKKKKASAAAQAEALEKKQ